MKWVRSLRQGPNCWLLGFCVVCLTWNEAGLLERAGRTWPDWTRPENDPRLGLLLHYDFWLLQFCAVCCPFFFFSGGDDRGRRQQFSPFRFQWWEATSPSLISHLLSWPTRDQSKLVFLFTVWRIEEKLIKGRDQRNWPLRLRLRLLLVSITIIETKKKKTWGNCCSGLLRPL